MKGNKAGTKRVISNIFFGIRYTLKFSPGFIAVALTEGIGRALWHIVQILFLRYFFDAVESGVEFRQIVFVLLAYTAYNAVFELFNKWRLNVYVPRARIKLHKCVQSELYKKARSLDLGSYDDPEFYNDFIWAIRESDTRFIDIMDHVGMIVNRVICSAVVLGVLAVIDPVVAAVLFATVAVGFFIKKKITKVWYDCNEEMNPVRRKISYINRLFTLPEYAAELRQGGISAHMRGQNNRALDEYAGILKKTRAKRYSWGFLSRFLMDTFPQAGITGYIIIRFVLDPMFTLGDLSAGISSCFKLFWTLDDISNYVNKFNEHGLYIEKVRRFMETEPKIRGDEKDVPGFESFELRNVSFGYNFGGEKKAVLSDISLKLRRGEKIAFVGYNGAGKTTLTKLIMRLYDVENGEILYNGRNIKDFDPESYRRHIGAVFQDYRIFAASLAENVLGRECAPGDEEKVLSALGAASFEDKLSELPEGIHTQLTTEFSDKGVGLSGGEAQKVAIARVFAGEHELMILDEPSSALDPVAEFELNRSIAENAGDKTLIFISHRLSTTRMADRIYMFEQGRIIESGTHDELLAQNGKYAHMYTVQAKKYLADQLEKG